jgi:hypothetical protein
VVFTMAGPILASSFYEAALDSRMLNFIDRWQRRRGDPQVPPQVPPQAQLHCLLAILLGNLDCDPAWHRSVLLIRDSAVSASLGTEKERLKAMLDCQVGFGLAVGLPVVFYIGSFVYSVFDVWESLGLDNTPHQLAFGMFWMIIPHVAIAGSLLLAGNNPSIWQVAAAPLITAEAGDDSTNTNLKAAGASSRLSRVYHRLGRAYTSGGVTYKPAWMWNRGAKKALWFDKLAKEWPSLERIRPEILQSRFGLHYFSAGLFAFLLTFVPVFTGALVRCVTPRPFLLCGLGRRPRYPQALIQCFDTCSWTTPQTGLGCRSLTMIMYGSSQGLLIVLFILDWVFWKASSSCQQEAKTFSTSLERLGAADYLWYLVFFISIFISIFTSVGGTSKNTQKARNIGGSGSKLLTMQQQLSSSSAFTETVFAISE